MIEDTPQVHFLKKLINWWHIELLKLDIFLSDSSFYQAWQAQLYNLLAKETK
jgi:hypothetical protein